MASFVEYDWSVRFVILFSGVVCGERKALYYFVSCCGVELVSVLVMCFPSPENSVAQSSSLKIAQLASQCCSRGHMGAALPQCQPVSISLWPVLFTILMTLSQQVAKNFCCIISCGIKVSTHIFNRKLKHVLTSV